MYSRSARSRNTSRLVAKDRDAGTPRQQLLELRYEDVEGLLEVVEDQQPRTVADLFDRGLERRRGPHVGADRSADRGHGHLGLRDRLERNEDGSGTEAIAEALADRHREPGLAGSAGPGQRHQPDVRALDEADDRFDVTLAPDERCGPGRQGAASLACRPRAGHRGPAGCKPLAQHGREVVAQQPLQLIGRLELSVGGLLTDPVHEVLEAGLAMRRRHLRVQQPGQIVGQLELLLQPRDLHAGRDLPVALPVEAHEDVALRKVRPVEVARRVRSRALLEHHRGEPERRDARRGGVPLVGELDQRRADEHAHTLGRGS
jgi:hypothetical protein